MINLDVCLKVLPWLNRISCLHRMVNQLEYGKLKCEVRTLLLFSKRKPEPYKTLHSLARWAKYTC